MVEFKKFKVSELFDYERGKESAPKKVPKGDIPLISETSSNNGFVRGASSTYVFPAKTITVSVNYAQTVFLQLKEFCASVNIIILVPKFDNVPDAALLYFVALLRANNGVYDYNYKISKDRLMNTVLLVPVTPAGDPDFEYMTMRIRELEAKRIRELEAYLHVTGLDDTTLSVSEAQALTQKVQWKKFRIGDVFDIHPSARKINANAVKFNGHYPYVARGTSTNGIRGYINWDANDLNPANTISFGQDTATIYYQDKPYFTGDKIQIFELKDRFPKLNSETAQFMIACMNAVFGNYTWGQQSFAVKKLREAEFMLPVTVDDDVDFDYMQNYIRAMEKQTIKGVVEYKDRVIAETKKVVGE